jgi:hypothetical protein
VRHRDKSPHEIIESVEIALVILGGRLWAFRHGCEPSRNDGGAYVCESQILIDDPVDYLGEKLMEFHLIYAGGLLRSSANTRRRPWEKHSIRRHLHGQLKRLWETHPALSHHGNRMVEIDHNEVVLNPPKPFLEVMAHRYEKSGIGFIPVMTEANGLVCSLDILFLRPEKPGSIRDSAGDIDNRIKTLIDALRIPADGSEMKRREGDDPDPNPMYCLLQDDKLITTLNVKTDRLLFTMGDGPNEACLIIRVETAQVDPFGSPWELHL